PEPELARRLAGTDGAIIMKLGRTFPAVRRALTAAGRLDHALYVERASMPEQRWQPVADVDETKVPYFSLIVVTGDSLNGPRSRNTTETPEMSAAETSAAGIQAAEVRVSAVEVTGARIPATETAEVRVPAAGAAELLVVGLGPGPGDWLTPEAAAALAEVDHVVGYGPYVGRVPRRPGLTRHASGNTVEVERARFALDLARRGEKVAVVSGGDAGIFGMAAAVFEAAEDPAFAEVTVRVLPGV